MEILGLIFYVLGAVFILRSGLESLNEDAIIEKRLKEEEEE